MDNPSRSERSRNAALQAAITIISRDGPGRLTLDAIARESGLSKGGLMHQFRTKEAVLKALLDRQTAYFEDFAKRFIEKARETSSEPELATQLATLRKAIEEPNSAAFAMAAAIAENPGLLADARKLDSEKIRAIKAEASDPQLALLRWSAARGLLFSAMFGMCPLTEKERNQLFERLLDDRAWTGLERSAKAGAAKAGAAKAGAAAKSSAAPTAKPQRTRKHA